MSGSLWPHGLQHARPPCPSPTPGAYSNSCPLRQWCHPIISSSVLPFSSCPQSFPASGSFLMSWFFASGGQSTGASASASVLLMNIQGWYPLRLTGLTSLLSKGLTRVLQHHSSEASILWHSALFMVQVSGPYMTNGKTIAWTTQTFVSKVLSLILQISEAVGWVLTLQFINIICRGVKVGWKLRALSSLLELIWQQVFHRLILQLFNQSTKRLECMAPRTSHPQQVKILHPWNRG